MKKYTVNFNAFSLDDATDETQTVIMRLIAKNHDILYGNQNHFEAYVRVAAKNVSKDIPIWQKMKNEDEWQKIDAMPAKTLVKKINLVDLTKDILNKREVNYLSLLLAGDKNDEIIDNMGVSVITGKRIKKTVIKKLKKWSKKDELKTLYQDDIAILHSTDISDLRYRNIVLTKDELALNDETTKNQTMLVEAIPTKNQNYTWVKKTYSGKITAKTVSKPAKKPDLVWYALPSDLDSLPLTYNTRIREKAALIHAIEAARLPDQKPPIQKHGHRDSVKMINQKIDDDYENVFDKYGSDIRILNR